MIRTIGFFLFVALVVACSSCGDDESIEHQAEERPHAATLNGPVLCARESSDFNEFADQIAAGQQTAAKRTALRLLADGNAMQLDAGTPVEVMAVTSRLAMIKPAHPTENGDQYSCFTYRAAVE